MPAMSDNDAASHRLRIMEEKVTLLGTRVHELANELASSDARSFADHAELERHRLDCTRREAERGQKGWQMWMVAFSALAMGLIGLLKPAPVPPAVNVTVPKDSIKVILPTKAVPQ